MKERKREILKLTGNQENAHQNNNTLLYIYKNDIVRKENNTKFWQ